MTITAAQLKAARALLGWSRVRLAIKSGVGDGVIGSFERGQRVPPGATLDRLARALEAAGVMFSGGSKPSVNLKAVAIPPTSPARRMMGEACFWYQATAAIEAPTTWSRSGPREI